MKPAPLPEFYASCATDPRFSSLAVDANKHFTVSVYDDDDSACMHLSKQDARALADFIYENT